MPLGPLISIVVPIYNVERYLDECLISIRQQTYSNLQIILVEDSSTDSSVLVIDSHLMDVRVHLIRHEKNRGLSAARNTGIEAAIGDYVMFVDSDDVIDPRLVESCLNCIGQTGADLVVYGFKTFNDEDSFRVQLPAESASSIESRPLGNDYFELPHFAWLKFVHRDLLQSRDMRFPVGLCYEDWPFHWGLGLAAKKKFVLENSLYYYRQRRSSITGSTGRMLLDLFAVQSLVMDRLQSLVSSELRILFANKMFDSHWSVLTRIEKSLLSIAIDKAKAAEKRMHVNKIRPVMTLRRRIIMVINYLPKRAALTAMRALRIILTGLSPKRRLLSSRVD